MRWRAAAGGFGPALSAGWNVANTGAIAVGLSHAYGVSLGVIGLFTTALFVTHAALQVPAGRLCDRFGARLVGTAGLVVTAAASVAALTWRDASFAIGMRALAGVGTGLSYVSGSDYVRSTVGSAFAQGVYGAGSMAGGGLALALVPQWGSWQAPFATAAIIAGVGALLLAAAPEEHQRTPIAGALPSLSDRRLLRLAAMHSASFGLSIVVGNWVVTLLERGGGDSAGVAGLAGALTLLLGIVTRPLGGRIYGREGLLRASFLLGGAGTAVLAIASPLGLAIAAAALVGLAAGMPFAASFAGAARLRPDAPAAAVGLVNMTAAVTILVATPLVGLSFSLPGDGRIGFAVVAALWALAALSVPRANGGNKFPPLAPFFLPGRAAGSDGSWSLTKVRRLPSRWRRRSRHHRLQAARPALPAELGTSAGVGGVASESVRCVARPCRYPPLRAANSATGSFSRGEALV